MRYYIPSGLLRAKARNALKGHFSMALLVTLIASLPLLLVEVVSEIIMVPLNTIFTRYYNGNITEEVAMLSLEHLFQQPIVTTLCILTVIALIATPFLLVGRNHHYLKLLRGEDAQIADVVSRVKCFFKALVMMLVRGLIIVVPSLIVVGSFLTLLATNRISGNLTIVYNLVSYAAIFFTLYFWLTYALADFVMADEPEKGAIACMRESRAIMRGHRMYLLGMSLTFVLYLLLGSIVANLLSQINSLLGLFVTMLLSEMITVYMWMSLGAFYEEYRQHKMDATPKEEISGDFSSDSAQSDLHDEVEGTIE